MTNAVKRAVYGKLSGDTTLTNQLGSAPAPYAKGVYYGFAPKGANPPYVIFQKVSGVPTYTFNNGGNAAFDTDIWMVKAVDHNTTADRAESIASRAVTLLNNASLSISGESLMYLERESDIDYPEETDGEIFFHSGANFRLIAQPS